MKRILLISCIIFHIIILLYFKYTNFGIHIINKLTFSNIQEWNLIVPLGLSFYTFKSISYLVDVYRNPSICEKNFFKYSLYISYFPQVTSGPIERSNKFFSELNKPVRFIESNISIGFIRILWGFAKKLIVVDRVALIVNAIYNDYNSYGGALLFVATLLYSIQIYFDFSAYSDISIGISKLFGLDLVENFNSPYLAKSVSDFWRRWHISLSSWFRDYLYIPLGGNRKGLTRKLINLVIVFLVSGLWHGASLAFILWGLLHGLYQVIGIIIKPLKNKLYTTLKVNRTCFSFKLGQTIATFLLINFAWIFFRVQNLRDALTITKKILVGNYDIWQLFDGSLFNVGVTQNAFNLMIFVCIFVLIMEYINSNKLNIFESFSRQGIVFRCFIYYLTIYSILIFGIYGPSSLAGQFIYGQF